MKQQIICIISDRTDDNDLKDLLLQHAAFESMPLPESSIHVFSTASELKNAYPMLSGVVIIDSVKEADNALALLHDSAFNAKVILLASYAAENDLFRQSLPVLTLQKPFEVTTLLGQVVEYCEQLSQDSTIYTIGDYQLNTRKNILSKGAKIYQLTEKEAALIKVLYDSYPTPLDKKQLLTKVWGYHAAMDTHTLETHIYRLRQKLHEDSQFLVTKASGYMLGYMELSRNSRETT